MTNLGRAIMVHNLTRQVGDPVVRVIGMTDDGKRALLALVANDGIDGGCLTIARVDGHTFGRWEAPLHLWADDEGYRKRMTAAFPQPLAGTVLARGSA